MTPLLAQRLRVDRSFERLYRRHVGDVYRYSLAVLRHESDAEDVTQTTFLNAYRAFARGERPRNAQNWLIAIAHNACRQRFRQAQRRPDEVTYDDAIGEVVPDEESGPTAADIQRALGHLAFNQRAALVMRELEGRSYAEIAEVLGLTVSAVETLIFRARRALREQLEGTLTCIEAERAISLQADGKLERAERGPLRAHLRECRECERLARSQRAQRSAFKALALVPLPSSLTGLFGGGAATGVGIGAKAAAVVAAGAVVTGVGYQETRPDRAPASAARASAAPLVAPAGGARTAAPVARERQRASLAAATPATEQRAAQRGRATAPPGQAKREAAGKPTPPGQAKKTEPAVAPARGRPVAKPKVQRPVRKPARAAAPGKRAGKRARPAPAPGRPDKARPVKSGGKGKSPVPVEVPELPVPVPEVPVP